MAATIFGWKSVERTELMKSCRLYDAHIDVMSGPSQVRLLGEASGFPYTFVSCDLI